MDRGRLEVVAESSAERMAGLDLGERLAAAGAHRGEAVDFAGVRAYLKGSPLRGSAARRYGLGSRLGLRTVPRLNEYANLEWLRAQGLGAPRPLAAGVLWRDGLPRFQYLVTALIAGASTLDRALAAATAPERAAIVDALAETVASMHAGGFVHRDLFARNVLVEDSDTAVRLNLIDCWAGGTGPQRRGVSYDLGCLFLDLGDALDTREQRRLLEHYGRHCGRAERGFDRRWIARVARERDGLRRRLEREPERLRGRPLPGPWPPESWPPAT